LVLRNVTYFMTSTIYQSLETAICKVVKSRWCQNLPLASDSP